ncbi:MAG TPA: carboxypeptidase-like regulatory domain-containing protein [Acidobacteriaceae bacterium]
MKAIALVLVTALLALWSPISSAQNGNDASWPRLTRPSYPVGGKTYRVTGRVLDNRTGKPISGATVCLERQRTYSGGSLCEIPPPGLDRGATTDADGHFVFDAVPAERIFVSAARKGYVLALRHRIGIETWAETNLTSDWSVDLYLARAASISGIARDHTGAVIGKDGRNGTIGLYYVEDSGGWPKAPSANFTLTSDTDGTYHFDNLYPGRYFLVVSPAWDAEEPAGTEHNRPVGEVPLRYPPPTLRRPAPLLTLHEGERKKVDLQIAEKTLHHVAFTENPETGGELTNASGLYFRARQSQRSKDAWYAWLPDGRYWLMKMIPDESDEPVLFRVAGADVSGLHFEADPDINVQPGAPVTTKGIPVVVQVSIDGSPDLYCLPSHPGDCDLANLQLIDVEPDRTLGGGVDLPLTASTKPLATTLLPGRYTAFMMARKNLYVKSLRSGTFDLSRGLLSIRREQAPAPIQVELARGAAIKGRVERNRKPVVAWVYALPASRAARASFRFFDPVKTRHDGTFTIDGLAPASWILFASDIGNLQIDIRDRADTAYWRRHGVRVHAKTGQSVHVVVEEARDPH